MEALPFFLSCFPAFCLSPCLPPRLPACLPVCPVHVMSRLPVCSACLPSRIEKLREVGNAKRQERSSPKSRSFRSKVLSCLSFCSKQKNVVAVVIGMYRMSFRLACPLWHGRHAVSLWSCPPACLPQWRRGERSCPAPAHAFQVPCLSAIKKESAGRLEGCLLVGRHGGFVSMSQTACLGFTFPGEG